MGPFTASTYTTGCCKCLCHSFQSTPVPGTNGRHSFPSSGRNFLPSRLLPAHGVMVGQGYIIQVWTKQNGKNIHTSCSCCKLCFFNGTPSSSHVNFHSRLHFTRQDISWSQERVYLFIKQTKRTEVPPYALSIHMDAHVQWLQWKPTWNDVIMT